MPKTTPVFVGLDVHKATISVAYAAGGTAEPPQFVGQIGTRPCDIDKLVRRLQARSSRLVFAYEAGPSGYVLHRHLTGKGLDCRVVAPSLIPKKPGDRVKNDRRDAVELARVVEAREIAKLRDDGERHEPLHTPQGLQGFNDRIQTPRGRQFEKLLLDACETLDLLIDGTKRFLEDDLLRRCGANDLGEVASMRFLPVGSSDVVEAQPK